MQHNRGRVLKPSFFANKVLFDKRFRTFVFAIPLNWIKQCDVLPFRMKYPSFRDSFYQLQHDDAD